MNRREFMGASLCAAALSGSLAATADEQKTQAEPFKKIKIAQIGVRHEHASGKIASLKMLPDYFEIVGIAAESAEEEAKHKNDACYRGLQWFGLDEIFDIPGLEAVAVETEMTELLPTASRCAERGFSMHVDKPLGQNLDECRAMFDVCRKNNVVMQPGYMYRTNQAIRLAIKAVREGWLGEIREVSANMDRNDTGADFRRWLATYRGGGMYDFGSHLIDFTVEMLGLPNEIHVHERPDPNDGLSDNTLSVLLYDRAIARLGVNERSPAGFQNRHLIVSGTKGRFELNPLENWSRNKDGKLPPLRVTMTLAEDTPEYKAGTHKIELAPFEDRYIGQLTEFAQIMRGEKENPYTLEYELSVQEVILAASGYIPWSKK